MAKVRILNIMHKRVIFDAYQMTDIEFTETYNKHFGLEKQMLVIAKDGIVNSLINYDRDCLRWAYLKEEEITELRNELVAEVHVMDENTIDEGIETQIQQIMEAKGFRKKKYPKLKALGLNDEKIKEVMGIAQPYLEYLIRAAE